MIDFRLLCKTEKELFLSKEFIGSVDCVIESSSRITGTQIPSQQSTLFCTWIFAASLKFHLDSYELWKQCVHPNVQCDIHKCWSMAWFIYSTYWIFQLFH